MIDNPHRRQKKYVNEVKDYITIAIAMIIGSVGWVVFLLPNKITTGGVAGIASIVYWGTGIPVQIPYFAINALLLLAALKVLGWKFCVKTIYAVTVFTLAVSVLQQLTEGVHLLADQPFMATIAGGCFLGISVGLGLCCNGSTGGSDVVAAIVNKEHDDASLQDIALVSTEVPNWDDYDVVLFGYPIWWREASWVVNNFIKNNDFTGKTVIPFCTSTSSGLGDSGTNLEKMAGTGTWLEGQQFNENPSEDSVREWVRGLDLE